MSSIPQKEFLKKCLLIIVIFIIGIIISVSLFVIHVNSNFMEVIPISKHVHNKIPFEDIIRGFYSDYNETESRFFTFYDKTAWDDMWRQYFSMKPQPSVDFSKYVIIAVFQGLKHTGGYSVSITDVLNNGEKITVVVKEIIPGSSCMTTQVLTSPFHIIKVTVMPIL